MGDGVGVGLGLVDFGGEEGVGDMDGELSTCGFRCEMGGWHWLTEKCVKVVGKQFLMTGG